MRIGRKTRRVDPNQKLLNILLTNGRFPVSLDLARQLHSAGHTIYVVDPMKSHVCRFSNAVQQSGHVPAPHFDPPGFLAMLQKEVTSHNIDLIIPLHEEVFHIALQSKQYPEIINKLFAPPVEMLMSLHNKWSFSRLQKAFGLDCPETWLVATPSDIDNLDLSQELAFKPCFGRAKSNLHHHKPGQPIPESLTNGIAPATKYVAQLWHTGKQYCTYAVAWKGTLLCFGVYPVIHTMDGSSCVYFESIRHEKILAYSRTLVEKLNYTGQMALDFIETDDRVMAIECNPRATSGIHLFSSSKPSSLAKAFTDPESLISNPQRTTQLPILPHQPTKRQLVPGMLMNKSAKKNVNWHSFVGHMKHLTTTRDVLYSRKDLAPSFMQPFLVMSYYEICRERKIDSIGVMFQDDLVWEPDEKEVENVEKFVEAFVSGYEQDHGKQTREGDSLQHGDIHIDWNTAGTAAIAANA
ncbi:hypothetical protein HDV00_007896 [Rhizophlyctis rosea]|nr:hypothetical protein HDV00_007896 [Rhizophlyctis rosea]